MLSVWSGKGIAWTCIGSIVVVVDHSWALLEHLLQYTYFKINAWIAGAQENGSSSECKSAISRRSVITVLSIIIHMWLKNSNIFTHILNVIPWSICNLVAFIFIHSCKDARHDQYNHSETIVTHSLEKQQKLWTNLQSAFASSYTLSSPDKVRNLTSSHDILDSDR